MTIEQLYRWAQESGHTNDELVIMVERNEGDLTEQYKPTFDSIDVYNDETELWV